MLDYGSGNLHSAQRALARVGAEVEVTADHNVVMEADGLAVGDVDGGQEDELGCGREIVHGSWFRHRKLWVSGPGSTRSRRRHGLRG